MEILTLVKAGIRRKKGTFLCVVLLTAIVVSMLTSMYSVRDNYDKAMDIAMEEAKAGDIALFGRRDNITEKIKDKLEKSELVSEVKYIDTIACGNATVDGETSNNSHFLMTMREGIKLYNSECDGFVENVPQLKAGEIYLPYGLRQVLLCEAGDEISYKCMDKKYTFVIKGFVQEPTQGAANIGWKQVFISKEDFNSIYKEVKPLETDEVFADVLFVMINQAEDSKMSVSRFQQQLNRETKIVDVSVGALNKDQSIHYTTLMSDVVMGIVEVFVICLFVVVLIVMSHSIGTEIETDYVDLGVLKAQGFTKEKIRGVMSMQYLMAELIGAVIGILISVPLERVISDVCMEITAILPLTGFAVGKAVLCVAAIILVSVVVLIIKTGKIARISPVRAISGGRESIYFGSRLQAPVSGRLLSASVAFRQFTSDKKRYIGTLFIISVLTFCMITVNLIGNLLGSRSAQEAMGLVTPDISLGYKDGMVDGCFDEAESIIKEFTNISKQSDTYRCYASLNGANYMCESYSNPSAITRSIKGREIRYNNELMITEMVADALELKIGDEVTVSYEDSEEQFIVVGLYQSQYDTGMSFMLNFDGAKRVGMKTHMGHREIILEDNSKLTDIENALKERCDNNVKVKCYRLEDLTEFASYKVIVDLLKGIIYTFSVIFSFVVVMMVCNKAFIQERRDIGIYKAMGFTSSALRISFGIRFSMVAMFGALVGSILSVLFSGKLLGMMLSVIGLSVVVTEYTVDTIIVPMILVSVSFFVFAYLASGKIKSVSVRELTVE